MTKSELNRLHQQGRRKSVLKQVHSYYGYKCACCGEVEDLEYHHIVPLYVGGTNNPTNIVVLCSDCHYRVHHGVRMDTSKYKARRGGKKPDEYTDDQREILRQYIKCEIPRKEAERIIGKKLDSSHNKTLREEMEKLCIIRFRNDIGGILTNHGSIKKGDKVGTHWIETPDDDVKVICVRAHRDFTREEYGFKKRNTYGKKS